MSGKRGARSAELGNPSGDCAVERHTHGSPPGRHSAANPLPHEWQKKLWFEEARPRGGRRSRPLSVDNFAGGGGASQGFRQAMGRSPDLAINHDADALGMHSANHQDTRHICESIFKVDPVDVCGGRPVDFAWFSPDCTDFSKAKGGRPVSPRVRGLAWIVLRWAARIRPRVIVVENVEEFQQWGPTTRKRGRKKHPQPCRFRRAKNFRYWLMQLREFGYEVDMRELIAADYGAPTIRKRLFIIARCDGLPIVWPTRTHAPRRDVESLSENNGPLRPWESAATCINWALPCPSIFMTPAETVEYRKQTGTRVNRPLKPKTMERIANGTWRYVINAKEPFIVRCAHGSDGFRGQSTIDPLGTITGSREYGLVAPFTTLFNRTGPECRASDVSEPMRTLTASDDYRGVVAPFMVPRYGEREGQQPRSRSIEEPAATIVPTQNGDQVVAVNLQTYHGRDADRGQEAGDPLRTVDTENRFELVASFMAKHFGGMVGTEIANPLPTTTAKGCQNQIVACHITKQNFVTNRSCSDLSEPLHTCVAGATRFALTASHLMKMHGTSKDGQPVADPLGTVLANGNHFYEVRAFLAQYYSSGSGKRGSSLKEPMPTVPTKDRFGLVTIEGIDWAIYDIGMRMLIPRELYLAQGFPENYIITEGANGRTLPNYKQVAMCGNSVPPPFSEAIVRANHPAFVAGGRR